MPQLVRPQALKPGDTVAIVAPASGLAALIPHRLEKAKLELEKLGLQVKVYPSVVHTAKENAAAFMEAHPDTDPAIYATPNAYSSADAIVRAQELMEAFEDKEVRGIICAIGGFTSHELLEYLDFSVITDNPKVFTGFSDITTMHLAMYSQSGLCTFYGPAALPQLGEFPQPLSYTMSSFWQAVSSTEPLGELVASSEWTDDKTANWFTKADMTYQDVMKPNPGYKWLRQGTGSGRILGGCLPVLLNVRGTKFMPDLSGAVLLLETPEGHSFDSGMALNDVNMVLGCLRVDGTFNRINGLVMGRAFAYSDEQVAELQRLVLYHTRGTSFPILYGVDCGHTNPIATIPLGCEVELDATSNSLRVVEAGVHA
jgi:muramoyltetrapeptide carboxypeptidase